MKTIHDIKTAEDMRDIVIQYNPKTIRGKQQDKLVGICNSMEDTGIWSVDFLDNERYFYLSENDANEVLMTNMFIEPAHKNSEIIQLEDFLDEKKEMGVDKNTYYDNGRLYNGRGCWVHVKDFNHETSKLQSKLDIAVEGLNKIYNEDTEVGYRIVSIVQETLKKIQGEQVEIIGEIK